MYKPLKPVTQKSPPLNRPSEYIALKYKVKQSKNGKFPSNYKLAQSIFKRKFPSPYKPHRMIPSKNKPLKQSLWKM